MPTPTTYTFSISISFINHLVNPDRLSQEISLSTIVIALNDISTSGDNCNITFKDAISSDDQTTLNTIVAAHLGQPLIQNNSAVPVKLYSNDTTPVLSSATGVPGQAVGKGLGGFQPDPKNNPYNPSADELVSLYTDSEGSLIVRGNSITDEGSKREDFVGSSIISTLSGTLTFTNGSDIVTGSGTLFTQELSRDYYIKLSTDPDGYYSQIIRCPNDTTLQMESVYQGVTTSGTAYASRWLTSLSQTGSFNVADSEITLSTGVDPAGCSVLYQDGDYLPIVGIWTSSLSQRIDNQTAFIGFRDDISDPDMYCDVIFDGTDNTKVKFRSAWNKDEESTIVTLPAGLDTSQLLRYKIDLCTDYCSLMINGVFCVRQERHIPDPYQEMLICSGVYNTGSTSNTDLIVDTVLFLNQDQLQISSNYSSPLPIIIREDQHSITSSLITMATTSDQIILSYTVPLGKVAYIIGYRVENLGSVSGMPIKIGRNDVTSVSTSPGSVDDNIFRVFSLNAGNSTGDIDFGSNPRKIGVGGDVIKITVTPSGSLSNSWYGSLDFVLR